MTHGRTVQAERIVKQIEQEVERNKGPLPPPTGTVVTVDTERRVDYVEIATTMIRTYLSRTFLGLSLMVTQAFLYNAVFFTEALVLTVFFQGAEWKRGAVHLSAGSGEPARSVDPGATFRLRRAEADDRSDLHPLWCAAGHHRVLLC